MSTQSGLILRGQINRRLLISEMDGNFTYLEDLALQGIGDAAQPDGQVTAGSGTGLTALTGSQVNGTVATGNVSLYDQVTPLGTNQTFYPMFSNTSTSGNTITGDSGVAVTSATNTTSTWPVRIIDVVPETAIAGYPGSYTEVIVKWNQGMHQYLNPLGV